MKEELTYLREMLETDQYNIQISNKLFSEHGIEQYVEQCFERFDEILKRFYNTFPPNDVPFWEEGGKPKSHVLLRIIMLLSANTQFHLAAAHLLRGQANEIWGHARRAIEAAGIAHLTLLKPELGQLYLDGNIKAFKTQTKTLLILPLEDPDTIQLNADIEAANQRLHQNWVSTASRIGHDMQILGERFTFRLSHRLYDDDVKTVLVNAIWLFRVIERTLRLFAKVFEIRDADFRTGLDTLRDRLTAENVRLSNLLYLPSGAGE